MAISNTELEAYNKSLEHRYEEDEEAEYLHIDWDCEKCRVESEISKRENARISTLPGNLPNFENSISHNISIKDLCIGDFARYISRPGTSNYASEYAECMNIETLDDDTYSVSWRLSNTVDKSFISMYDKEEFVNVISKLKRND